MDELALCILKQASLLSEYLATSSSLSENSQASDISPEEASVLANYLELLKNWTDRVDLVSVADDNTLIQRHLLDSIAAHIMLKIKQGELELDLTNILDLGSGAGLPGIVLAILNKQSGIILCEPREKRTIFLKEVQRRLQLNNVIVEADRYEKLSPSLLSNVSLLISRAVSFDKNLWKSIIKSGLKPSAHICLMQSSEQESANLPANVQEVASIKYQLSSTGPSRALKFFKIS